MRELTAAEIESFASSPNADRNIVRGILSKIGPNSSTEIRDLFFTAKFQGWSRETIQAILSGISRAATPHKTRKQQPRLMIPQETRPE